MRADQLVVTAFGGKRSQQFCRANGLRKKEIVENMATESPAIVPLYEYVNVTDGSHLYSTNPSLPDKVLQRSAQPLCRVWRNPLSQLFVDSAAKPFLGDVKKSATLQ
jgi:hypothetical protein